MAKTVKLFYIGRRYNPQFAKPYFRMYGQLSKREVKEKEKSIYGSMSLTGYSEENYNIEIQNLKDQGFRIS